MPDEVPILGFHAVEDGPAPLCLPARTFARQVRALHESGCTTLTVSQVAEHIAESRPFPPRAVALTFDDAYASVHRVALPLLAQLGMTATVYPVTSELGGHNRWDAARGLPRLELVTREQLRELAAAGWEVGGHTHTHSALVGMPGRQVAGEIAASSAILEDLCGRPVRTFAYPYGGHDVVSRTVAGGGHVACLGIGAGKARLGSRLDRLERIDAWYLQRVWSVRHLHDRGGDAYLRLRRGARAAGRLLRRQRPG